MNQAGLIIVDFQEDFCPPHGALAVDGGRDISGVINNLLDLPFAIKVATQDWHPHDHISFASNHPGPNNKPFESSVKIQNPKNPSESVTSRLWPVHCVQETRGAQLVPELHVSKVDHVIRKGLESRVEMYSAFRDPFKEPCVCESELAQLLRDASVSSVYVVGLAADFCVKQTALHAAEEGFETFIVAEATRAVDGSERAMKALREDLKKNGVQFQSFDETVERLKK